MSKAKVHGLLPNKLLVEVAKDPCLAIKIPLPRGLLPDTRESWEEIIRYHSIDLGKRLGEIQFDTTKYKNVFEIASEGLYRSAVWSLGNILEPGRPPHVRMNFDDLLYMPVIMGAPVRALNRYDLVFVDEAQDFSSVRLELVLRIAGLDTDATVKQAKETEIFRANGMQTNDAGMPILDDQSQRGADATECELASEADSRLENPDDEEARVQWASQSRDQETSTSPHPAPGFASDGSTPLQPAKAATAENEAAESPCDAHDPGPVCRIIAVGDEGQAIYRFAGAHSKVLQSFDGLLRPTTFVLPVTYRCATKIVKMANLLVPDLVAHPDAERGSIARCDIRDVNLGKNDMVLCRERNPMILYAFHLLRMGRAAEVVGTWIGGLRCVYLARAITCATEEDTRHKLEEWNIQDWGGHGQRIPAEVG
jgi:superfamily I DNA/RNA helicase